ncbi:MAG TPA: cupin domain-containing protein [Candidatus Sulfotelmatobacter sp.]|nr:cupin domain-containing protein [Candidatus Sulfotelmatobacter sp.]
MNRNVPVWGVAVLLAGAASLAQEHAAKREPLTFPIDCSGGDCPLLKGAPQTSGMRGGSARLKPGESVGWHSTGQNEEALTILRGSGVANIEGHADVPLHANMVAYIPPATRHNVTNTGNEVLEYVWIVAPVAAK